MLLGIDHVVIACRDPDEATAQILERVGLEPGGGGRHPGHGTFNQLVWLGDSYLELIAVDDPDLARGWGIAAAALAVLERGREGFAAFAIASDSLEADVAALRAGGAPYDHPKPGQRQRPDRAVVRWRTALPKKLGFDGLPFLIEHEYAEPEWGPTARAARAEQIQPFGGKAVLARLELGVRNPVTAGHRYHENVGLAVLSSPDDTVDLPIGAQLLRFARTRRRAPRCSVVIAGSAGSPRSVDLLGCRFEVEVATLG